MPDLTTPPAHEPDSDLFGGTLPKTPGPAVAAASAAKAPRRPRGAARQGVSPAVVLLAIVAVAVILWGAWMTKAVAELKAHKTPIASVRLQPLIEEYVQGQARSGTPEQLVMRQTQAFMAALDDELLKRGRNGTTVLVAEAVLSKNVPDVTAEVRRAVYARVEAPAAGPQARMAVPAMPGAMAPAAMGAR